jgi:hypothetical protein
MGPVEYRREAVVRLENMFVEERPDLNIITHDADIPFPKFVAEFTFDLVVLGATFLSARTSERRLEKVRETYGETIRNATYRVALPQDDYDSSAVLDEWMTDWGVHTLYCVIPDRWEEIYPRYSKVGRMLPGFTGYITDGWLRKWSEPKPRHLRSWDVTYRTNDLGALRCNLRHLKFAIAERFLDTASGQADLRIDISSRTADHIAGLQWHAFLEDSRFCLATPSGSSFLDPHGAIRHCVARLQAQAPNATIHDAWSKCFPADIPDRPFSAISPRHIEAGLALTVQIATLGDYSGLMRADEHYIRLEEDCGNIAEVFDQMKASNKSRSMAESFKESLLSEPRLRRKTIVDEVVALAENAVSNAHGARATQADSNRLVMSYADFLGAQSRRRQRAAHLLPTLGRLIEATSPQLGHFLRSRLRF